MKIHFANILTFCVLTIMLNSCGSRGESSDEVMVMASPEIRTVTLTKIYPSVIEAARIEELIARVNGEILGIYASPGSKVTEGQLIYYIDDTPYLDAVHEAHVALSTATAEYENSLELYQSAQRKASANEISAEALKQAKETMDKKLLRLNNARSALAKAEEILSYCRIRAPFNGTLSRDTITQYAYVGGETNPLRLATVANDDTLCARISLSVADLKEIENFRQNNSLSTDSVMMRFAEPLNTYRYARIGDITSASDSAVITLFITNDSRNLSSGLPFNAHIPYGIATDAIIIKNSAVVTDKDGSAIFTVDEKNHAVRIPIKPGPVYNDSLRIVESGLGKSRRYIVNPPQGLKEGQTVNTQQP
ncbi:MAG: efflux RND transporter periplasmic adaptor subunit [Paramuribaculum sp.]|nr:efflux RND transporter periplasmic adaptor subunit [Paramuribaculum sp.]